MLPTRIQDLVIRRAPESVALTRESAVMSVGLRCGGSVGNAFDDRVVCMDAAISLTDEVIGEVVEVSLDEPDVEFMTSEDDISDGAASDTVLLDACSDVVVLVGMGVEEDVTWTVVAEEELAIPVSMNGMVYHSHSAGGRAATCSVNSDIAVGPPQISSESPTAK